MKQEIRKSIASYAEDALVAGSKAEILVDETVKVESEEEVDWRLEDLRRGDVITVTALADENFYAGLYSREGFVTRRKSFLGEALDFPFATDKPQFTKRLIINEDDDYYLVIRVGFFSGTTHIEVKVKRQPGP